MWPQRGVTRKYDSCGSSVLHEKALSCFLSLPGPADAHCAWQEDFANTEFDYVAETALHPKRVSNLIEPVCSCSACRRDHMTVEPSPREIFVETERAQAANRIFRRKVIRKNYQDAWSRSQRNAARSRG